MNTKNAVFFSLLICAVFGVPKHRNVSTGHEQISKQDGVCGYEVLLIWCEKSNYIYTKKKMFL